MLNYQQLESIRFLPKHQQRAAVEKLKAAECIPVCKKFGCGKNLSPREALFSDYCVKHN